MLVLAPYVADKGRMELLGSHLRFGRPHDERLGGDALKKQYYSLICLQLNRRDCLYRLKKQILPPAVLVITQHVPYHQPSRYHHQQCRESNLKYLKEGFHVRDGFDCYGMQINHFY